ncbi:hypothetical protein ABU614_06965 [Lysobacter firmicutimachus]|uniref:Uncharacterized protein n=1 Tax=Lysobacter firmicutimachus TaxID=1792846 RepID=A0AAU8MYT1_9GAMM
MNEVGEHRGIACIGWGSLIWRQESLPLRSAWFGGGPELPVEFARQSRNKSVTLVICPGRSLVPTRWAILDVPDIQAAKNALAAREWNRALEYPKWVQDNIGYWDRTTGAKHGMEADIVTAWASAQGLAGVVWTNLPCNINGVNGSMPSEDDVLELLRTLEGKHRHLAEEYVRNAPREVDTPYRRRIAREFGWE